MVRRARRRSEPESSSTRKESETTTTTSRSAKDAARRIRSQTPPPGRGRGAQQPTRRSVRGTKSSRSSGGGDRGRGRGSSSERKISTPWTTANTDGNNRGSSPIRALPPRQAVPATWTTACGKFEPKESDFGFDASSNVGINRATATTATTPTNSVKTGTNSEYSPSNNYSVTDNSVLDDNDHNNHNNNSTTDGPASAEVIMDGEIQDPVARHRFYKNLKKAGIKKVLVITKDNKNWNDDDEEETSTIISEMSVSDSSYILDLAQQKETREKDREEEALEEALELYGTWLTEGKTDDKNIFLMILHEVKKEHKDTYAASDKHHDALLDEALEAELERRKMVEKKEEEKEAMVAKKKETEDESTVATATATATDIEEITTTRKIMKKKKSAKIDKIIESQKIFDKDEFYDVIDDDAENDEHNYPKEWNEPYEQQQHKNEEVIESFAPPKRRKSGLFSCFGGGGGGGLTIEEDVVAPTPIPAPAPIGRRRNAPRNARASKTTTEIEVALDDLPSLSSSPPATHDHPDQEDSKSMFSRLRVQLSEKKAEQLKEEDKWWKIIIAAETEEDKWWKKINDAKTDEVLFHKNMIDSNNEDIINDNEKVADNNDMPASSALQPQEVSSSIVPASTPINLNPDTSTTVEAKKEKGDIKKRRSSISSNRRKSKSLPIDFDISKSLKELSLCLLKADENDEKGALIVSSTNSEKKKKKKRSSTEGGNDDDSENHPTTPQNEKKISKAGVGFPLVPGDEKLVSPKSKDKKKKSKDVVENNNNKDSPPQKNSNEENNNNMPERSQSFKIKKKRKSTKVRDGSTRTLLAIVDESESQSVITSSSLLAIVDESESKSKSVKTSSSSVIKKKNRRLSKDGSSFKLDVSEQPSKLTTTKKKKSKSSSTRSLMSKNDGDNLEKATASPKSSKMKKKAKSGRKSTGSIDTILDDARSADGSDQGVLGAKKKAKSGSKSKGSNDAAALDDTRSADGSDQCVLGDTP